MLRTRTDFYDTGEVRIEYAYDIEEIPGRHVVREILGYFFNGGGKALTAKELEDAGFIPIYELELQQILDAEYEEEGKP